MVAIRFRRDGNKNRPFYRLVAIDKRKARDAGFLELLGTYNPLSKEKVNYTVNLEAVDRWISNGAQTSETAASVIKKARKAAAAAQPAEAAK